jgi:hypothetical protein
VCPAEDSGLTNERQDSSAKTGLFFVSKTPDAGYGGKIIPSIPNDFSVNSKKVLTEHRRMGILKKYLIAR